MSRCKKKTRVFRRLACFALNCSLWDRGRKMLSIMNENYTLEVKTKALHTSTERMLGAESLEYGRFRFLQVWSDKKWTLLSNFLRVFVRQLIRTMSNTLWHGRIIGKIIHVHHASTFKQNLRGLSNYKLILFHRVVLHLNQNDSVYENFRKICQ